MGLQLVPGFISGGGTYQHPVELFRNLLEGISAGGSKGILTPTSFALTPSGSLMQLTVGAGYAIVAGLENSTQGSYFAWSSASEVLAWPSHPVSNSRWDTLVLRIIDSQYGVDASADGAYWEICQGTAAASPTKITDSEFLSGGDFYRPGAWYRVADVLVQSTDTNMAATDITSYLSLVNPYQQRVNAGAVFLQRVIFTAGGTFTKANYPNMTKCKVMVQGGGAGGGGVQAAASGQHSAAGGGGGGGYAESWIDAASISSTTTVTVSGTALGGIGSADGANGGTSSFGAAVVATGGTGGSRGLSTASGIGYNGGNGGIGTAGDLRIGGHCGQCGSGNGGAGVAGGGGGSFLGGGAAGQSNGSANTQLGGAAGQNYGGGGSGAVADGVSSTANGGPGAAGIVIVDVYA